MDEQAVLVEDRAKAAVEAAKVQEQLAEQQKECAKLGSELAAAQKHGQELDCSMRAMTAEKVSSFFCKTTLCLPLLRQTPGLCRT